MRTRIHVLLLPALLMATLFHCASTLAQDTPPLRVAVVGLTHGHVGGFFEQLPKRDDVQLIGIVEQDAALVAKYKARYSLDAVPVYSTINELMEKLHPAALLVYTPPSEHRRIVQDAAAYGVNVMVEKPLATTLEDALIMRRAARQHKVQLIVNYETTWYASNRQALAEADHGRLGDVWKVVVRDGHNGPREIGVPPEFLHWLTDPAKNGAGALFDFGCYGADLATVLMHGAAPISVTAVAQTDKPAEYSGVDDDATVVLRYPHAQAILEPSWNWPFSRKDMEVYGESGYTITVGADHLRRRYAGENEESTITAHPLEAPNDDPLHFLEAAIAGKVDASGTLGGIDTNITVIRILVAARESSATGKTVTLQPLPSE